MTSDDDSKPIDLEPDAEGETEQPVAQPREATAPAQRPPLVRSTHPEWALATAGTALALHVAASLSAQRGLFPISAADAADPAWSERALMALRGVVLVLVGGGCLVAGAAIFATIERRPFGDLRVLVARALAIAALALLVRMIPIDLAMAKRVLDGVGPIVAAWALAILFLRLTPRESGMLLGGALLSLVIVAFGSAVIGFALR
jgi:hypothetical protein